MLTLEEVKTWLRVDGNNEDNIIRTLMGAAESTMIGAITGYRERMEYAEQNPDDAWSHKADLCKLQIIAWNYEHRTMDSVPTDCFFKQDMLQLQLEGRMFKRELDEGNHGE